MSLWIVFIIYLYLFFKFYEILFENHLLYEKVISIKITIIIIIIIIITLFMKAIFPFNSPAPLFKAEPYLA